jgi:hypothetical protein
MIFIFLKVKSSFIEGDQVPFGGGGDVSIRGEGVIGGPIVGARQLTHFSFLLGRTSLFLTSK